jgi:hypothetical protein
MRDGVKEMLGQRARTEIRFKLKRNARQMKIVCMRRQPVIGFMALGYHIIFSCIWLGLLTFMIAPSFIEGAPLFLHLFLVPFNAVGLCFLYSGLGVGLNQTCVIATRRKVAVTTRPLLLCPGIGVKASRPSEIAVEEESSPSKPRLRCTRSGPRRTGGMPWR